MSDEPQPQLSRLRNELISCGILLIGIPLILFVIIGLVLMWAIGTSHIEREIAGSTMITSNWLDLSPKEPLKPSNSEQSIRLEVTEAYVPDKQRVGMRFPDGSLAVPEVQLVDVNGTVYQLDKSSLISTNAPHEDPRNANGLGGIRFHKVGLPQNRIYRSVRIRSDRSFRCSKIMWEDIARK